MLYKDFGELAFDPLWHFPAHGAVGELPPERRRLPFGAGFEAALEGEKLEAASCGIWSSIRTGAWKRSGGLAAPEHDLWCCADWIFPGMQANSLTKQKRRALVELLKAFPIDITGKRPVSEAIITSGGVKVSEIDPKTMESSLWPGCISPGRSLTAMPTPAASTCRSHGRRPMPQGWRLGKTGH